jgi:uncharacterized membrane protein YkgB
MTRSALRITPSTPAGMLGGVTCLSVVNRLVRLSFLLTMPDPGDALLERKLRNADLDSEAASG